MRQRTEAEIGDTTWKDWDIEFPLGADVSVGLHAYGGNVVNLYIDGEIRGSLGRLGGCYWTKYFNNEDVLCASGEYVAGIGAQGGSVSQFKTRVYCCKP